MMADCSRLVQTGLGLVQEATQADVQGSYREALRLYSLALEAFVGLVPPLDL